MSKPTEYDDTVRLANKILDRPNADPDDDLAMLSRQFLRQVETVKRLRGEKAELLAACKSALDDSEPMPAWDRMVGIAATIRAALVKAESTGG